MNSGAPCRLKYREFFSFLKNYSDDEDSSDDLVDFSGAELDRRKQ
jgi:hypothetical protein